MVVLTERARRRTSGLRGEQLRRWVIAAISGVNRPGFHGGLSSCAGRMESMARPRRYPDEFRERAVRLVREWRAERGLSDGGLTVVAAQPGLHRETCAGGCWSTRPMATHSRVLAWFGQNQRSPRMRVVAGVIRDGERWGGRLKPLTKQRGRVRSAGCHAAAAHSPSGGVASAASAVPV
jgi:hypothetical protein